MVELKNAVDFKIGTPKQIKWATEIRNRIIVATQKYILPNIEAMKKAKLQGTILRNPKEEDITNAIEMYFERYNQIMEETSTKEIIDKYKHIRTEMDGLKIFSSLESHDVNVASDILNIALQTVLKEKGEM